MWGSDSKPANLLVKRKLKDDLVTKAMILKKHKKTILVRGLSKDAGIADIIDFFKDVGQVVVRVQLVVHHGFRKTRKYGFVKFASSNEAEKALQKIKNLPGPQTFAQIFPYVHIIPRYCKDHKVWNKDFILREEDDTPPPKFVENVLFVSNLSPQTKVFHIIDYFSPLGQVVSVRLVVNPEGKHVGYGFVELGSAYQAHKALEKMNGEYLLDHKIFIDVAKLPPYRLLPEYNFAEKLCYEDYLRRGILVRDKDETGERLYQEAVAVRNKTIFVNNLSPPTKIQDLIDILKDVGKVVNVRLLIDCEGNQTGDGYVEFASAEEAEKALEKKYLDDQGIFLFSADSLPEFQHPKYCIDHKVWYEDYLGRENRLIEDDDVVEEGFDETHDFAEEVAIRKKTLFVYNIPPGIRTYNLFDYYKNVGHVCRVRLVVNHEGDHVGCGFVEFASAEEAMTALLFYQRSSRALQILSDVVEMAPYPIRPKYMRAEKLWNEEYLRQESLRTEEDYLERQEVTELFCGKKKTFSDDD
ncbi:polyadenylate-binding protein 2 isoform X2 [Raphanus sativus]|uniref:Polyadenylate-binding protein 2 isoform X2 n=1 Tax=Raphanus sativus TaxID=3726 RepID=A0A9W3CNA4_RAPSA|nr:polyadenylate-binding protein 2 isoform X2 [Raphanus sativus]